MDTLTDQQEIILTIRRGLWDSRPRQIIIAQDYFQFQDKKLPTDGFTRFDKTEITDYRFGINWISGYQFTIGREYQIFIRNRDKKVIKIHFKSFYGYKKKELLDSYNTIVQGLATIYFSKIVDDHLTQISLGQTVEICNVQISKESVTIQTDGLLKKKKSTISWDKVGTRDYFSYYAIFSTDNSADINKTYHYLDDWNVGVLYSVMETFLRQYRNGDSN